MCWCPAKIYRVELGVRVMVSKPLFEIGQIVHHKLFDYRGAIYAIDPVFSLSDDWYDSVAKSRPPKNAPWYGVLVHNGAHTCYVAEQNLELEQSPSQISHPELGMVFGSFLHGRYQLKS